MFRQILNPFKLFPCRSAAVLKVDRPVSEVGGEGEADGDLVGDGVGFGREHCRALEDCERRESCIFGEG